MTGLLISVRNKVEADAVISACPELDILDVKEPQQGALGPATPEVWHEIAGIELGNTLLSIALGELEDAPVNVLHTLPPNTTYAKIGLAHQRGRHWIQAWRAIRALVSDSVELVGVIYADYLNAQSPEPEEIVKLLSQEGCRTFLVDTYLKNGSNLFDSMSTRQFNDLRLHAGEATFVVAGSLNQTSLDEALQLQAEYLGVRGAICKGDRLEQACPQKSRQILSLVKTI